MRQQLCIHRRTELASFANVEKVHGDGCADGEKCIAYTNCGGTFSPSSTTQRLKVADLMPRLSRAPSSAEPRCSSWKTTAKVPLLVHMAPMIPPNPTRDAFQPRRAANPSPKLRKLFIPRRGEFYWCINKKTLSEQQTHLFHPLSYLSHICCKRGMC